MQVKIEESWGIRLASEFAKPYFADLVAFVRQAYATGGGRNGIGLQFGFRWAIGKKPFEKATKGFVPEMKKADVKISSVK